MPLTDTNPLTRACPDPVVALREQAPPAPAAASSLYDMAEVYDAITPPGPCEAFYRAEARRAGGPVLELACGTGRLTIPLARDGHEVVGLDASPAMLLQAGRKAAAAGLAVTWVSGDMRRFDLGRRFGFVLVSCNSLGHMTEPEDLRACLEAVRRHLAPGGVLAFDVVLPDPRNLMPPADGVRRLDLGPNPASAIPGEERVEYDPVRQIRTAYWRVQPRGRGWIDLEPLVQRQFFPHELPLLLGASGLELMARYGDFARNPLAPWSLNQVCLARRAD
ncbi:class I SAM-dependent methyltransferase [Rubellimicrobium rubrum]|nr:class I SAM-dependent methyltransferase [Rubellimicrobium rubrum]